MGRDTLSGEGTGKNPIEEALSPLKQHDGHNMIQLEQYTAQGINDTGSCAVLDGRRVPQWTAICDMGARTVMPFALRNVTHLR